MTETNGSTNAYSPAPVTDCENKTLNGKALCAEHIYQGGQAEIEALRGQQKEYWDALPSGRWDAFFDILKSITDLPEFAESSFGTVAVLQILNDMAVKDSFDGDVA